MQTCPHCGGIHPQKAKFCTKTGLSLVIKDNQPGPIPVLSPTASQTPPAGVDIYPKTAPQKLIRSLNPLYYLIGVGVFLGVAGVSIILFSLINNSPQATSVAIIPTGTVQLSPLGNATDEISNHIEPTATPVQIQMTPEAVISETPTQSPVPQPTPTETKPAFITQINEKDQAVLVYIPAGEFIMGSDSEVDPYFWGAESPRHKVTLSDYWIYQTEVTNEMYQQCVSVRACPLPTQKKSRTADRYYDNPDFAAYPVIYVGWVSAEAYCEWAGGRLPTEAQWEKAARGDQDERLFPWGNTPATGTQANFCDAGCGQAQADREKNDGYASTAPVRSYPEGVSPYGLYDTAGNVWEWVFDWFQPTYSPAAVENPIGPASSRHRAIRGGSWSNPSAGVRIVQRDGVRPDLSLDTLGFRCVVEITP